MYRDYKEGETASAQCSYYSVLARYVQWSTSCPKIDEGICTILYGIWVSAPQVLNLLGNVLSNLTNMHDTVYLHDSCLCYEGIECSKSFEW